MIQTMIRPSSDIRLLMERIRKVDLQSADSVTLQSVGGLLLMLLHSHPSAPSLLSMVHDVAVSRFRDAVGMEDQSRWLHVLLHISGNDRDTLFCDVLDDDDFDMLDFRREEVERWWQAHPSFRPCDAESSPQTEWQLLERQWQSRLYELLHASHPVLSGLSEADLVSCGCKSLYSATASKLGQSFIGFKS